MKESFENLRAWRILEAIDRKKSITKASIEQDISLSNASKLIGKLEKGLGCPVINRTARPVQLTDYAKKLMPAVRDLLLSELLGVAYTQIRNPDSNLSLLGRS